MRLTEFANAKVNLCLDVVGRRPDGYHEVVSVMQSISLADTLHATRAGDTLVLRCDDASLCCDERNLVLRAANAFFDTLGNRFGVEFFLEKRIPMQAGLGGGSADAAAALRLLNRMAGEPLGTEALCRIGAGIGADVPFCVVGGTAICRGIGEKMTPIANRMERYLVVAMAGEGVSTPRAFADLDDRFGDFQRAADEANGRLPEIVAAMEAGDTERLAVLLYNRFEDVIEPVRPAVSDLKRALCEKGARFAHMSGTGPSVFGVFACERDAALAASVLVNRGVAAFACSALMHD